MRCSPAAEAPATPPSNKTQSTGSCVQARGRGPEPAQDRCAASHGRLRAPPGPRPRLRPPRRSSPSRHVPCLQQQAGGKEDILSSATGPSTARCSKDVTTHQHRPGARPGCPCPVPACSGQPLPGERRFSSALGNRVFYVYPCAVRHQFRMYPCAVRHQFRMLMNTAASTVDLSPFRHPTAPVHGPPSTPWNPGLH